MTLDNILALPFEQYIIACWTHAYRKAQESAAGHIVYSYMLEDPNFPEALWAKRYWFNRVNELDNR